MKNIYISILLVVVFFIAMFLMGVFQNKKNTKNLELGDFQIEQSRVGVADFQSPLDKASERLTKKTFGIYIDPKISPIQPEKFKGYHTGVDFEIFPEELDTEIQIRAICSGELKLKKYATGYGGIAVQSCKLDNEPITVIYGHLRLSSVGSVIGDKISIGDIIGVLGKDKSTETDGERRHLHLGIHRGNTINILGYVNSQSELLNWVDPCLYVCKEVR